MRLSVLFALVVVASSAAAERLWSERPGASPAVTNLPNFRDLAQGVIPAVVSIAVEQRVQPRMQRGAPFGWHEFFQPFGEIPREFHNRGIGTGFVISKDGLILTNNHVVEDADTIEVSLPQPDGTHKQFRAKTIGTAPKFDVALIQIQEAPGLSAPICFLGDSDTTLIGDWVMAVGNPFGLSHSVSVGIISAKERRDIVPSGKRGIYDFMQTDADINPGNSGGPLVNMRGEVIAINSAINAQGSGIGFAIPINMVKSMLPSLKEKGTYVRSYLGVGFQPVTADLAETYGLKDQSGALVAEVTPGGPAAKAGIREGDVILEFEGKPIRDANDLPLYAGLAGVGARAEVRLLRERKEQKVTVTMEPFPDEEAVSVRAEEVPRGALGITIVDINEGYRQEFDLDVQAGVLIRQVAPASPAARAGIQPGDVVLSLNGEGIRDTKEFARVVAGVAVGTPLRLHLRRGNSKRFVALRKPAG
jgi:serine protease Do